MIASQRHAFDLPEGITYLNCAYLAPQLRTATEAGIEAVGRKRHPWTITPPDFFDGLEQVRERVAGLVGGDADGVAVVPSVSYAMSTAAANLPVAPGEQIVVLAEQFPSNVYPWRALAARAGGRMVTVARPRDADWTSAVEEVVGERTAVVAVPNCHWTDGTLVDLERIGRRCREVDAALVVDATQSLGALPFDVGRVQPDVVVAAGYKWLLGPFSIGFAWFRQDRRDWTPLEHGWASRAGSEDFGGLVDYRDGYRPGARRFDVGEAANFVLVPMALAALDQLAAWGVEEIAATLGPLTSRITDDARALGLDTAAEDRRAPHLLGLRVAAGAPPDLARRLAARDVHVSVRGDAIRVSPHVYNDAGDLRNLHDALSANL